MEPWSVGIAEMILPVVGIIAAFTFVSVVVWSENRRRERQSYYRQETYQKMLEQPGESAEQVREMIREQEALWDRRRVELMRLGGLLMIAAGIGTMIFLYAFLPDPGLWTVGVIPILIGAVLAVFAFVMDPSGRPRER